MTRLSKSISRVDELTHIAPENQRSSLAAQVAELRNTLRRHRERYETFVKLSKEYADEYLQGLSDEIKSQETWLARLERRLDLARQLQRNVAGLKESFRKDVCDELKGACAAVRARPLVEEAALFKELNELIDTIKECYIALDNFWMDEVRHVTQALKLRIEHAEVDRWRKIDTETQSALDDESHPNCTLFRR
ncbi:hypothetical protein FA95DRAFT_254632 [Auriscalpium vulgare]|uniref:Uncharacterized protein n=1 Tax=Auriscalpium vulgare TaxID=40419 RepID=A0ACB8RKM8_9AGAM|nr:hypothetical protein FA95DRAFT_254632 [Auriscalpium vulgare]